MISPYSVQKLAGKLLHVIQNARFYCSKKTLVYPVKNTNEKQRTPIVVTSYFNPCKSAILLQNYHKFWQKLQQQGVSLFVVELAFNDQEFDLTQNDATYVHQVRSSSVLWQKERLYNLAVNLLPPQYTAIIFLDADVYYLDDTWLDATVEQLKTYVVVQPFSYLVRLPPGSDYINARNASYGFMDGQKIVSCAKGLATHGMSVLPYIYLRGSVGIGLAVRRELVEQQGLYDAAIVGGGDHINLFAAMNKAPAFATLFSARQQQHFEIWRQKWYALAQSSIGYSDHVIYHYYHGGQFAKNKWNRHFILKKHHFDPYTDIQMSSNGTWEWSSNKPDLQVDVQQYFLHRSKTV